MSAYDYDVMIVGAGLAGSCLALALRDTGLKIAVVEATSAMQRQHHPAGGRALALSAGTVQQLEGLGVWAKVKPKATAIKTIHVSDRGHFGKTRLSAAKEGVEALGYVVAARNLEGPLFDEVVASGVTCLQATRVVGLMAGHRAMHVSLKGEIGAFDSDCQLLVGADGGNSSVRKLLDIGQIITDYQQTALITSVQSALPNHHTAYERFTVNGPLALLPVGDYHSAVIWTQSPENAEDLLASNEADFLAALQLCFGYKLGALQLAAPRHAFPLSLVRADSLVANRAVLVGNAAHQLHPVAGQGFNLGARDVVDLAAAICQQAAQGLDIGSGDFLRCYAKSRQQDHQRTIGFTHQLVRIFSNDVLPVSAARNVGLTLLEHLPMAKSILARHAMGLVAGQLRR
jgi:2-octaprenyl-6-methoxyphenol hydroxylase